MMCKNGKLQLGQPTSDNQAMRASFVIEDGKSDRLRLKTSVNIVVKASDIDVPRTKV